MGWDGALHFYCPMIFSSYDFLLLFPLCRPNHNLHKEGPLRIRTQNQTRGGGPQHLQPAPVQDQNSLQIPNLLPKYHHMLQVLLRQLERQVTIYNASTCSFTGIVIGVLSCFEISMLFAKCFFKQVAK